MPGREIIPIAAIALIIGINPALNAPCTNGKSACWRFFPNNNRASIALFSRIKVVVKLSSAKEIPVIILPKIMPNNGKENCGFHHGSGWICVFRAIIITKKPANIILPAPIEYPQMPANFLFCRAHISRPANRPIMSATINVKNGEEIAKIAFNKKATMDSCTIILMVTINNFLANPKRKAIDRAPLSKINIEANARSQ